MIRIDPRPGGGFKYVLFSPLFEQLDEVLNVFIALLLGGGFKRF